MYNVQDYSDISHSAIHPVVCEGWHFIHVETNGLYTWYHKIHNALVIMQHKIFYTIWHAIN